MCEVRFWNSRPVSGTLGCKDISRYCAFTINRTIVKQKQVNIMALTSSCIQGPEPQALGSAAYLIGGASDSSCVACVWVELGVGLCHCRLHHHGRLRGQLYYSTNLALFRTTAQLYCHSSRRLPVSYLQTHMMACH